MYAIRSYYENRIVGRISIRDVYKHMAIPDHLIKVAHLLGDRTDQLDLPEMKVSETLKLPVEMTTRLPEAMTGTRYARVLPVPVPASRITSYNVCYTKLLREQDPLTRNPLLVR